MPLWLVSGRTRIQPKLVWLKHPLNSLLKAPTNAHTSVRFTLYACAGQLVLRSLVYSLEWENKAEPRALDTAFKCPQKAGMSWSVSQPTLTMCSSLQGAESDWHHRLHPDRDLCLPGSHPAGEALHPLPGPCPSEKLLA